MFLFLILSSFNIFEIQNIYTSKSRTAELIIQMQNLPTYTILYNILRENYNIFVSFQFFKLKMKNNDS